MPSPQPAKLSAPRLSKVVARERLFSLLDSLLEQRPVWVHGPPGAGKTALTASFAAARNKRLFWYQLDAGDADLSAFFYYLSLAAPAGETPLPLLTPEYLADLNGFARRFFRLLNERLPADAMLAFDNYHELPHPSPLHALISMGIGELSVPVILISREAPPPEFSERRLTGGLDLLEWNELRLMPAETRSIAELHGVHDDKLVDAFYRYSDGWVAGLTLMLERARRTHGTEADFYAQTREMLFGYFAAQILAEVLEPQRRSLVQTALLPHFTIALARELTRDESIAEVVQQLHRRQLFTDRRHAADSPAQDTYQYHALFRDYLLGEFHRTYSLEQQRTIREHAAVTVEQHGMQEQALPLYVQAGSWDRAATLIKALAPMFSGQGRSKTLLDHLDALGEERVATDFWLLYWKGMALLAVQPAHAHTALEAAFALAEKGEDNIGQVLSAAGVVWTYALEQIATPMMAPWVPVLERLAWSPELPPPIAFVALSGFHLAAAFARADHPRLHESALRLLDLMDEPIDVQQRVTVAHQLLQYFILTGDYDIGHALEERMRPQVEQPQVAPLHKANWYFARASLAVSIDDERALSDLQDAERIGTANGLGPVVVQSLAFQVVYCGYVGDVANGASLLERLRTTHAPHHPAESGFYHVAALFLAQAAGQPDVAYRHARLLREAAHQAGGGILHIVWGVSAAAACAYAGHIEEARDAMADAEAACAGTPYQGYDAAISLLKAFIAWRSGERDSCEHLVKSGLRRMQDSASQTANARLLLGILPPILSLSLQSGIEVNYVRQLIKRFGLRPPEWAPSQWPWPVRIRTCSRFSIEVDGQSVSFGRKAPARLLDLIKLLVAMGGKDVDAVKLSDALWEDAEGDRAEQAFTNALYRVRGLLGYPDALILRDGLLSLNPAYCWVDVWAVETTAQALLGDSGKLSVFELAARGEVLLDAYAGPFLALEAGDAAYAGRRTRTHAMFLRAIMDLGTRLERANGRDHAVVLYERALAIDPGHEPLYRALMSLHRAHDRVAEARSVYVRCESALRALLREPSSDLRALFDALR